MDWVFIPLDNHVNRDNFDCGIPELNEYLKKYAKQNQRKGVAITFVAISEPKNPNAAGYYSVSMGEIKYECLPENYRKGLPRYPVPVLRIAKLAVDKSRQGERLGEELLMECFRKAIRLSKEVGIYAIIVDATNQKAKRFYQKYGFIPLEDNPLSLFIPIKIIVNIL